jgi:hypothetical protein
MALPHLQATRVSERSMPIITCVAFGAGAKSVIYGRSRGHGAGDIGAKIVAEVARTGLSADEIDLKVNMSYHAS